MLRWTKRASSVCSPDAAQTQRLLTVALWSVALPLCVFIVGLALWYRPVVAVFPVQEVEFWLEPIGNFAFDQKSLKAALERQPDFARAVWKPVQLPYSEPLAPVINFTDESLKARAWFKLRIPPELLNADPAKPAQLGLLANRIMSGPWALWAEDELLSASLVHWRIQWNEPIRVEFVPPQGAGAEPVVLLSFVFAPAKGFAVGSVNMGLSDSIAVAWNWRSFWQSGLIIATTSVAAVLMLVCLQLSLARKSDTLFPLLAIDAMLWLVSGIQFVFDPTGYDQLSYWYGWAIDAVTDWVVIVTLMVSLELAGLVAPRLRAMLIAYAVLTTVLTLPVIQLDSYVMVAQHLCGMLVALGAMALISVQAVRLNNREVWLIALGTWIQLILAAHDIYYLSSQHNPDHYHLFSLGAIFDLGTFMYIINRRYLRALDHLETHQQELRDQLQMQALQLAQQHATMRQLEVEQSLRQQHQTIMQDLHDHVGSHLATAVTLAHRGTLGTQEFALLLQELGDELRHLSRSSPTRAYSLNDILSELRQRVQHRLSHLGITLRWLPDPYLPDNPLDPVHAQHLRAMLSEAITNCIKHANASEIVVRAHAQAQFVLLRISDNGQGFDPAKAQHGRGLDGFQYRAQHLGGRVTVQSTPGQGCVVAVEIPLP